MRSTIRHAAVLAAAVAMFAAIAVPAQGAGGPPLNPNKPDPLDLFEVTCYDPHYVVAVASDESPKWEQWLNLTLLIPTPDGALLIDHAGPRAPASSRSRSEGSC